jgi:hypothetical protein
MGVLNHPSYTVTLSPFPSLPPFLQYLSLYIRNICNLLFRGVLRGDTFGSGEEKTGNKGTVTSTQNH